MPDLNEILAKMLTDVRSGAAQRAEKKRKATVKKKEATERPIFEAIRNPWIDESITLLINEYHCSCPSSSSNAHAYGLASLKCIRKQYQ